MADYVTSKPITIPKGTRIAHPAPLPKEPIEYGSATFEAKVDVEGGMPDMHVQIPFDAALRAGLIEEAE